MHACMHACMHAYIHAYIRTYARTHVPTYVRTYLRTYVRYVRTLRTYVCTYTHTYIRTYMYAYYEEHGIIRLVTSEGASASPVPEILLACRCQLLRLVSAQTELPMRSRSLRSKRRSLGLELGATRPWDVGILAAEGAEERSTFSRAGHLGVSRIAGAT